MVSAGAVPLVTPLFISFPDHFLPNRFRFLGLYIVYSITISVVNLKDVAGKNRKK